MSSTSDLVSRVLSPSSGGQTLSASKTVHQIWFHDRPLPDCYARSINSVSTGFPGWDILLWTNDDLKSLAPHLLCGDLINDVSFGMGIRREILKIELLRLFGGVFVELDLEFYRDMEEIMMEDCIHAVCDETDMLQPALFAAPRGHSFLNFMLERLKSLLAEDPLYRTGYRRLWRNLTVTGAAGPWLGGNWDGHIITSDGGVCLGWLFEHGDLLLWSKDAVCLRAITPASRDQNAAKEPRLYAGQLWTGKWFW